MATSLQLLRLMFLLVFFMITCCFAAPTKITLKRQPGPGFIYTRTRGRCTPLFWSSRKEAWPKMVPQGSAVSNVFGSIAFERYRSDMTMLESTAMSSEDGNVYGKLVKQASAALINSYARKGFPYSAWEVKTLMIQGLVSEDAAARLTKRFSVANDACN